MSQRHSCPLELLAVIEVFHTGKQGRLRYGRTFGAPNERWVGNLWSLNSLASNSEWRGVHLQVGIATQRTASLFLQHTYQPHSYQPHMKKRGVTVIVVCDDEDVPEYATQHIDSGRVTSYIASEAGKVRVQLRSPIANIQFI